MAWRRKWLDNSGYFHKVPMELATLSTKIQFRSTWQNDTQVLHVQASTSRAIQATMRLHVLCRRNVGRLHQQREHTIHEELYIDTFIATAGLVYWWPIWIRHHAGLLCPAQASLTSCRDTVYCMGVNGLEAQMAGHFHKFPMELDIPSTKLQFPSTWRKQHTCIGLNKQSNVSDYATTCVVTT